MKFNYCVEVELEGDETPRVFFTEGNDSNKILKNITTVLDQCRIDYKRVEVRLGS